MNIITPYLFVYGSLRSGFTNPAYQYLAQYFSYAGEGIVKGTFYEKNNSPVAVPTTDEHFLVGELYKLNNAEEFSWSFEQLDDYEGIHVLPGEEALYKRALVEVLQNGGTETAWIYWYNKSVADLPKIETGDLHVYLQQKNLG